MNKYKPEMLIHIYDDEDIDMYETFESAYGWICEGAKCGSSIDEEDMEEIEKLYKNKNKTHNDMIKILNISGLRGCEFNVLSEHYIIDKN
jgi:hypothetical protein